MSPEGPPAVAARLVYASTTVIWTSYALLSVTLPFRFQELGLSVVQYGVALAVFALGMLITEGLWGVAAFRIGNFRTMLAMGLVVALLYVAVALSTSFVALTISLGLYGAAAVYPVPLFRWMALTAGGPGREGTGTGRYGMFFSSGMVVGSAVGPLLFVALGFSYLMVVVIATYAVGLALVVVLPWREIRLPRGEPGALSLVRRVLTSPFLYVSGLVVLAYLTLTLVTSFLQIYSVASFHGTTTEAGFVIGGARATLLVAGVLLGRVVDRFGPSTSAPFGFLLIAAGAVGTLFSGSYAEMVVWTLVLAVGFGWLTADLLPLALRRTPLPLQGTAVGVFGSFEDLGLLVGPIIISGVYATFGVSSIFVLVGVVALLGSLVSVGYRRIFEASTPRSSTSGSAEAPESPAREEVAP